MINFFIINFVGVARLKLFIYCTANQIMNVIVCGDLPEPLVIYLEKTSAYVSDLKRCIQERTNIPQHQQALYLGERPLFLR